MGNTAINIATHASGLAPEILEKDLKEDLNILNDQKLFFNHIALLRIPDLNNYCVPGSLSSAPAKTKSSSSISEEKMMCSIEDKEFIKDRQEKVLQSLLNEIDSLREEDSSSVETGKKFQYLCRTYEALLKMDEREKRKSKSKALATKNVLSPITKAGLTFNVSSLLGMVKVLGPDKPELYKIVIESASNAVAGLGPMALYSEDPSISQLVSSLLAFFNSIFRREFSNIREEDINACYSILFELYVTTGNLCTALALALAFSNLDPTQEYSAIYKQIFPMIKSFKSLTAVRESDSFTWDSTKKGEALDVKNEEPGLLAQTVDGSWQSALSIQTWSEGVYYFEMTWVESHHDSAYYGICKENYSDLNSQPSAASFNISYKSTGGVFETGKELHQFERYIVGDKAGILLNMDAHTVLFFHNRKPDPKGIYKDLPPSVKIFMCLGGISRHKIVCNPLDMPEMARELVDKYREKTDAEKKLEDLSIIDKAIKTAEMTDEYLKMKPIELSKYILKSFDCLNDRIIEQFEKKVNIEKCTGLSLDIKNETVEILESLALTCTEKINSENVDRESKEIYSEMLVYVLRLMRSHLIGSDFIPDAALERQLTKKIEKNIMDLIISMPGSKAGEEATKIVTTCFFVFHKDPQEKLSYLLNRLKDQIDGVEISGFLKELEEIFFLEMARPDMIFPVLELINDKSQHLIETYFKYLIELSSAISQKLIRGEKTPVIILKLIEASQTALFCQAAKSNFNGKWQEILMNYSLSVFHSCEKVIHAVKEKEKGSLLSEELTKSINKTVLGDLLETLLYMLSLTKMDLDFLANILSALQSITSSLQHFDPKSKILNRGYALIAGETFESTHPYGVNLDLSYTVKIPGARKYYLVFSPQCKTELYYDILNLWKDDKKEERLYQWYDTLFPKNGEKVEVNAPYLHFTFKSWPGSSEWGWKIDISGEVQVEHYSKQWPDTIKDAASILSRFISEKLISGDFETREEDKKVKALLQNPLLRYGISDKTFSLVKHQNHIPESLITLMKVPGMGEKFKPKMLNQFIISAPIKKLESNNKSEITVQEYIESFGNWGDTKYSDNHFINDFIEGNGSLVNGWKNLKLLSGVDEGDSTIGGPEFDKAERAIFTVYITIFELEEIFKAIIQDPSSVGPAVKYLVKDAVKYRIWAEKYNKTQNKAVSMTFEEIYKDIVFKCALLINSQHAQGLNELGIVPSKLKMKESEWKHVNEKAETDLSSVTMLEAYESEESEDVKEINKISELILSLFEISVPHNKIADTIEKRRIKAIARVLGLSYLENLMSLSFRKETSLVRSFVDSLKENNVKYHYWENMEGVDSSLLKCVQKSFYNIYGHLQKDLFKSKNEVIEKPLYSYNLTVLDALCSPLRDFDNHMIVEQQFSFVIGLLLNWSKGYIGKEIENNTFHLDQCITGFKVMQEADINDGAEKIILETREGEGQNLYLTFERRGVLPVVDFQVTVEEIEGYENVAQFTQNGETKYIFIKKSEPSSKNQFLVNIKEDFQCEYKSYNDLLEEETELFKDKLCKAAWCTYKYLAFSIVGNVGTNTSAVKQTVQDLFLSAIFNELKWNQSLLKIDSDLNLKRAVSGEFWVNKMNSAKRRQKNPMQEWIRQFNQETEKLEESILKESISKLVAKADPTMKGVLTSDEISKLDPETSELLSCQNDYKNSNGNFDFFRYIKAIYAIKDTFSKEDQAYIKHSKLWSQIPDDFEQAALSYDFCNISIIHKNIVSCFSPSKQGKSFTQFIELFNLSEVKGIVRSDKLQEDCPKDFKNEEGDLDLYVAMRAIAKDQNKYSDYYQELKYAILRYDDLPGSCLEIYKQRKCPSKYITSILWSIYGCLGSNSIINILAREEYISELLKITFLSNAESNFALGSRIIKAILPSQHSPETIGSIWSTLPLFNTESNKIDFIQCLLKKIGKMSYWYGFRDKKTKLLRCGFEATVLLKELMSVERWRIEVIMTILKFLNEACAILRDEKPLPMHQIGVIEALAILLNQKNIFGNDPIELAEAKLLDSNMARSIVLAIDKDLLTLYSPITDETVSVDATSIAYIKTTNKFNVMKVLTQDELQQIKDSAVSLWRELADARFSHFNMESERIASFSALYSHLENSIVNIIRVVLKNQETDDSECADLLRLIMKRAKAEVKVLGSKGKNMLLKQIVKKSSEKYMNDDFTDEEVMEMISNATDETKHLVEELTKENISKMTLVKCLSKGINDINEILKFDGEIKDPKPNLLFKLLPLEAQNLATLDIAGDADIYQNADNQFVIENNNFSIVRKQITTVPDLSAFSTSLQFAGSLTILAQLEGIHYNNELSYGLRLGAVDIGISTNSGSPRFEVNGRVVSPASLDQVLVLRIYLKFNGEMKIVNENSKESIEIQDTTAFNGSQMGSYGLYMETGESASLLTFEVYEGNNEESAPINANKSKIAETYKIIKAVPNPHNYNKLRLKLLGLTDDQITQTLSSNRDLRSSLDYISQNFSNAFQNAISSLNQYVITDIKLFKSIYEIPNGFTAIPIYEDGKQKEFNISKRMILCVKKEQIATGNACSSIKLGASVEDHTSIGNFDPNDQASDSLTCIWVKKEEIDKCTLKDLIFIKSSSSLHNLEVPFGYEIIKDKEGNTINLGHSLWQKSALVLAIKRSDTVLNCALNPFQKIYLGSNPLDIIETAKPNEERVEEKFFDSQSIEELFGHYYKLIDASKQSSYKKLALMLIKKYPFSIAAAAKEFSIIKLLDFVGNSANKIAKQFDVLLSEDNPEFKDKLYKDCLERILQCLIYDEQQQKTLAPLIIESRHPYKAGSNNYHKIRVSGVKKLRFVFDPQCKTEKDHGFLRFYKKELYEEIKSISGEEEHLWAPFEVYSDTVHVYFTADKGGNFWGYKFEVISVTEDEIWPAVWILNKISNMSPMPKEFVEITSPRCVQPIFLHSFSADTLESKLAWIRILGKIIKGQKGPFFENILNILITQANELYIPMSARKLENRLLQATVELLEDASHEFQLAGEESWFTEYCEFVSDIKGLSKKDERLDMLLFDSFKKKLNINLERTYESKDPYIRKTSKEFIQIPEASSFRIVFDSNSSLDPRDAVAFSYDEMGKELIKEKTESIISNAKWRENPCGNKVTFENGNSKVTRKKQSGWGNAIWSEDYSDGIISIKFKIESDGNSEHFYIGVYKTAKDISDYDLNDYIGCDCFHDVWSWKRSGEVHKKGWFNDNFAGFSTGDEISMLIDMNLRELTFFNGFLQVFKFTDIASSVTPVVCFGSLNQAISITSVEIMTKSKSLSEKTLDIAGDSFYYWIPVHKEANIKHAWNSSQNGASLSPDRTVITKSTSNITYHEIEAEMKYEKYYVEVSIEFEGSVGIGFAKKSSIDANEVQKNEKSVIYYSEGKIGYLKTESYESNDVIGSYIDFDKNEIAFYKNHKMLGTVQSSLNLEDSEDCFRFIAVLSEKSQKVSIRNTGNYPDGVDLLTIDSEQETNFWGYKFSLIPKLKRKTPKFIDSYLSFTTNDDGANWRNNYKPKYYNFFKDETALNFISLMDDYMCDNKEMSINTVLNSKTLTIPRKLLSLYPDLQKLSEVELFNLKEILFNFNSRFYDHFDLIDLHSGADELENSLIKFIKKIKRYLLFTFKLNKIKQVIDKSKTDCRIVITLDKSKVQDKEENYEIDNSSDSTMFSQISKAVEVAENKTLRHCFRMFRFRYKGEEIQDDWLKYKELYINISNELQSSALPLVIPSQNNLCNIGNERDTWIINPASTLPVHMKLFTTLGKFFGSAVRSNWKLYIWISLIDFKHILGESEDVSTDDLREFDFPTYQLLQKLRNLEGYRITAENFSQHISEKFIVKYGEKIVELCENGANINVTFENAKYYADLLEKHKLAGNPKAYDAIRKGMACVIPIDKLSIITPDELRYIVNASQDIKIELLEENTQYENCEKTDPHIENFWMAVKRFDTRECRKLLEYIARRRSLYEWNWPHKFTIARHSKKGDVNSLLPITDNIKCRLELPAYTSPEIMEERIRYAMTNNPKFDSL